MKNDAGFTLLELAVTLAVVAILAALVTPNFMRWSSGFQVRSAAVDLSSNLQAARMRAIREGRECAVAFNPASASYRVACLNKTVNLDAKDDRLNLVAVALPAGNKITFDSRGFSKSASTAKLEIQHAASGIAYHFSVPRGGTVRMERL